MVRRCMQSRCEGSARLVFAIILNPPLVLFLFLLSSSTPVLLLSPVLFHFWPWSFKQRVLVSAIFSDHGAHSPSSSSSVFLVPALLYDLSGNAVLFTVPAVVWTLPLLLLLLALLSYPLSPINYPLAIWAHSSGKSDYNNSVLRRIVHTTHKVTHLFLPSATLYMRACMC